MSKQFIEGNTYVFTKKKFIKKMGKSAYTNQKAKSWVDNLNGREVVFFSPETGLIDISGKSYKYLVRPAWCKCIKEGDKS